jgi:hypothetical protein
MNTLIPIPKVGDSVRVRLFDGAVIVAVVVHVWDHAEGVCLRVRHHDIVNSITLAQVLEVIRG